MWWMCFDVSLSGNTAVLESVPKPQQAELHPPTPPPQTKPTFWQSCRSWMSWMLFPFRLFPLSISPIDLNPPWSINPSLSSAVILIVSLSSDVSAAVCVCVWGGVRTFAPAKPVIKVWRYTWNHYTAQLPGDADRGYSRSKSHPDREGAPPPPSLGRRLHHRKWSEYRSLILHPSWYTDENTSDSPTPPKTTTTTTGQSHVMSQRSWKEPSVFLEPQAFWIN